MLKLLLDNLSPPSGGFYHCCSLYLFIMLYQLQICTNGTWENTVYPPSDWEVAQRRLEIYTSNFPEEKYALLEIPVV